MKGMLPEAPEPQKKRLLGKGNVEPFEVRLRTVTPILGGGAVARKVDALDPIRAPSVRGQLRFWWRTLYGHQCKTPEDLARREGELWGYTAREGAWRSRVDVGILKVDANESLIDRGEIAMNQPEGYARWSSRGIEEKGWKAGVAFTVRIRCPEELLAEVENAVRAWILFGGYGARVRRGCGSLTVVDGDVNRWLPASIDRAALTRLFGDAPIFRTLATRARDVPSLVGARLLHGQPSGAEAAWSTAIRWLRDFRQGDPAREPGDRIRPGRSRWPEADKVRQLSRLPPGHERWQHPPRHNTAPAWPRASFGLPIVGQFQKSSRERVQGRFQRYPHPEPDNFELRWMDAGGEAHGRLASPLILKALPLAGGRFVPIAVWLFRGYPAGGKVFLKDPDRREPIPVRGSEASFERLRAPGDPELFLPLQGKPTLEDAFLDWLKTKGAKELPR